MKTYFLSILISTVLINKCSCQDNLVLNFNTDLFNHSIHPKNIFNRYLELDTSNNKIAINKRKDSVISFIHDLRNGKFDENNFLIPKKLFSNKIEILNYESLTKKNKIVIDNIDELKKRIYVILNNDEIMHYFLLNKDLDKIVSFSLIKKNKEKAVFFTF